MKYTFLFLLTLFSTTLFSQENENSNVGNLSLKYFKVERVQIGGNYEVQLNKDFDFLKLFKKGQRFAPDEPSSFSSLEYTFYHIKLNSKFDFEATAGIFRNHIKGDIFLFQDTKVHFGLGNSTVGVSSTGALNYSFAKMKIGYYFQAGVGPQFTQWTSDSFDVEPPKWGIKGRGFIMNTGIHLESPKFWNRFTIRGFLVYHVAASTYGSITTVVSNVRTIYSNINFSVRNKNLIGSIGLSYDLKKNK